MDTFDDNKVKDGLEGKLMQKEQMKMRLTRKWMRQSKEKKKGKRENKANGLSGGWLWIGSRGEPDSFQNLQRSFCD